MVKFLPGLNVQRAGLIESLSVSRFPWLPRGVESDRLCRWHKAYNWTPLWGEKMARFLRELWAHDEGQDIAEYAVMLAVILVLVVGTIRLVGSNANNAFSAVASSIQ